MLQLQGAAARGRDQRSLVVVPPPAIPPFRVSLANFPAVEHPGMQVSRTGSLSEKFNPGGHEAIP